MNHYFVASILLMVQKNCESNLSGGTTFCETNRNSKRSICCMFQQLQFWFIENKKLNKLSFTISHVGQPVSRKVQDEQGKKKQLTTNKQTNKQKGESEFGESKVGLYELGPHAM